MKRLLLVLVIAIIAALLIMVARRQHLGLAPAPVANLLPADTAVLIQIPDVEKNRDDWHRTDLYQLYREPAVQEFLQKPLAQMPKQNPALDAWRESASLRMENVFLATNNFETPRIVAGFQFRCDAKQASNVIDQWKARLQAHIPGLQRNTSDYEKHPLDVMTTSSFTIASTIIDHQFLAATTLDDLKALIDRVESRNKSAALSADANFTAAMKQMPRDPAWLFYVQPKQLAQKLINLRMQAGRGTSGEQQTLLERVQSFSHAMVFDGTKIREIGFAAMPRLSDAKLSRDTLNLASTDTLLYLASILNLQQQVDWMLPSTKNPSPAGASPVIVGALASAGVTAEDFKAAFGEELSVILDWGANTRIPSGVATLNIRDATRANKIVKALAPNWQTETKNNAQYYTLPTTLAFNAIIAVTDKLLVAGYDAAGVDRAVNGTREKNPLTSAPSFRDAAKLVPDPQQMFIYLDVATLYARIDALIRPMLPMSAALVPGMADHVDATKLPSPEIIGKHLTPVVASQSYVDNGYRSESVGSVTIGQAAIVGAAAYAGWTIFQTSTRGKTPSIPFASPSPSAASPSPTP